MLWLIQIGNGAIAYAQKTAPPKKSQLGRWKGMDEDQSDDQVGS